MPSLRWRLLLVAGQRSPLLGPADPGRLHPLPVLPGHGRDMIRLLDSTAAFLLGAILGVVVGAALSASTVLVF